MEESKVKDEERVSRLLGRLPAVDAPENFEGIVRSRIASHHKSDSLASPVFWLAVKFAAPMLLLVLIGVFFVLSDDSSLNVQMVPPIESPIVAAPDIAEDAPSNAVVAGAGNPLPQRQPNRNVEAAPSGPLSQKKALEQDDTTIFPPGVDPRRAVQNDQRPPSTSRVISPLSILAFIGISSGCSPVSCTVRAVAASSTAEKSGIRIGDVIEAIDDRPIDSTHLYSGAVNVRSLRVVRDGERITIPLTVR